MKTHWISTGWPPNSLTIQPPDVLPDPRSFPLAAPGGRSWLGNPGDKGDATSLLCLFVFKTKNVPVFCWGESFISEKSDEKLATFFLSLLRSEKKTKDM